MRNSLSPGRQVYLWDLPIRIFHWSLALAVLGLIVSAELGGEWMEWHARLGLLVLGLIVFRIIWGFIGSSFARFNQFLPSPKKIANYLQGKWRGYGHNPIGALSVLAMIGALLLQSFTGLFSSDDIAFNGPLYAHISSTTSLQLTHLHKIMGNVIVALVALHILAILFYQLVKGNKIIAPMITGYIQSQFEFSAKQGGARSLLFAILFALIAVLLGSDFLTQWISTL